MFDRQVVTLLIRLTVESFYLFGRKLFDKYCKTISFSPRNYKTISQPGFLKLNGSNRIYKYYQGTTGRYFNMWLFDEARSFFWLEHSAFRLCVCLTTTATRLDRLSWNLFGINVLGTKAKWRYVRIFVFLSRFNMAAVSRSFSQLRSNIFTDSHEIWNF